MSSAIREASLGSLPAIVAGGFAIGLGTFSGGARIVPTAVGWGLLWLLAGLGADRWRDPLSLGRAGPVVWLLWLSAAVSLLLSPVPRAGSTGVILLPLFLLAPAGVANCWRRPEARRWGLRSLALVFATISVWALLDQALTGSERASMPLGHHNLLALWLVTLGPLVTGSLNARTAWWIATLGILTLIATQSLAGSLGLASVIVLLGVSALLRRRRSASRSESTRMAIGVVLGLGAAVTALAVPQAARLVGMMTRDDTSVSARWSYLKAGWQGFLDKPLFGWGPGSSSWLMAEHLRPEVGVHPPHQVVSDFHSVPIEILFEGGASGMAAILLVAVLLCRARWRAAESGTNRGEGRTPGLGAPAALSVVGFLASGTVSGLFDVTALFVAVVVVLGALLASERAQEGDALQSEASGPVAIWLLLAVLLVALVPRARAQWHYERYSDHAHGSSDEWLSRGPAASAAAVIARAADLDPSFPLYRWLSAVVRQRALPVNGSLAEPDELASLMAAAGAARGLAPLWLAAGSVSTLWSAESTERALLRSCDLDPLGGFAPLLLVQAAPQAPEALEWAARALLLEPRLIAAVLWREQRRLLSQAIDRLIEEESLDAGWRLEAARQFGPRLDALDSFDGDASSSELILQIDQEGETSLSLFAFRRRPLPWVLSRIPLDSSQLEGFDLITGLAAPDFPADLLTKSCGLRNSTGP